MKYYPTSPYNEVQVNLKQDNYYLELLKDLVHGGHVLLQPLTAAHF